MKRLLKKLTALSLAVLMVFGLAACGNSGNGDQASSNPDSSTPGSSNSSSPDNTSSYADEIVIGITSEPQYLEPNAPGVGPSEINVTQQIY